MVHLAIAWARSHPTLRTQVVLIDAFPHKAQKAGVISTPTWVFPTLQLELRGSLPPSHVVYRLWEATQMP